MADLCSESGIKRHVVNKDSILGKLALFQRLTLVIVYNVTEMIAATVVGFAHAHRVVGQVDVAVIAED